jgi:predicted acylesterase/phospholipase RssA
MRTFSHPVPSQPAVSHRPSLAPRTAFVLAGGASLGAMQVGMLRGLYERAVAPDLLVGTSAGALNAAFIASHPQTVATVEAFAHVWRTLHRVSRERIQPTDFDHASRPIAHALAAARTALALQVVEPVAA